MRAVFPDIYSFIFNIERNYAIVALLAILKNFRDYHRANIKIYKNKDLEKRIQIFLYLSECA